MGQIVYKCNCNNHVITGNHLSAPLVMKSLHTQSVGDWMNPCDGTTPVLN